MTLLTTRHRWPHHLKNCNLLIRVTSLFWPGSEYYWVADSKIGRSQLSSSNIKLWNWNIDGVLKHISLPLACCIHGPLNRETLIPLHCLYVSYPASTSLSPISHSTCYFCWFQLVLSVTLSPVGVASVVRLSWYGPVVSVFGHHTRSWYESHPQHYPDTTETYTVTTSGDSYVNYGRYSLVDPQITNMVWKLICICVRYSFLFHHWNIILMIW